MPKYRRNVVPGGMYFFTVVTNHRRPFLTSDSARTALRDALRHVRAKHLFTIDAIVLLPDHLHTVWTLPEGDAAYPLRWKQIKSRFTQLYLAAGGVEDGVSTSRSLKGERGVWQRRYYEHTIRDERDLKHCIDYLHFNPVRHGLVKQVRDWPSASFHRYVALGEYDIHWGDDPSLFDNKWLK